MIAQEGHRNKNGRSRPLTDAVVGYYYDVPCIRIVGDTVYPNEFLRPGEFVPVLLPAHEDAEYFEVPYIHYHIDFRFVTADLWTRMQKCATYVHACIVTASLVGEEPRVRSLLCVRAMPDFPTAGEIAKHDQDGREEFLIAALRGLELHYRKRRIDIETLLCPHRGICLRGLPAKAGVVVCPAHGLAWNVETGALARRHHIAASGVLPRNDRKGHLSVRRTPFVTASTRVSESRHRGKSIRGSALRKPR